MSSRLSYASIAELRAMLRTKELTVAQLRTHFLNRMKEVDPHIDALIEQRETAAPLDTASESDPLYGIPGIVKNNICIEGVRTTCSSRILENFKPTYTATVVDRLHKAGAFVLATANMDEFAMGSSTETSAFKKTKNPWDTSRVPGGSSGGSAAAVAAGMAPWALGSDTGGSIRQPAALCGIVGMRPTYGLVSRYGLIAYGSSLDQVGPLTRTVADNAAILSAIAGNDTHDSSTLSGGPVDYTQTLTGSLPKNLRIGIVRNALDADGIDPEIRASIDVALALLEKKGAQLVSVTIPSFEYSAAAYFIISRAEAASNLARYDGVQCGMRVKDAESLSQMYLRTRHDGFGEEVRRRIMVGNYVLSAGHAGAYYQNACKVREQMRYELQATFNNVDVLVMPTSPVPAFSFGAYDVDKLQMDLQDYFTCPANLAGIPALSIPCGFTQSGLPIGLQLLATHSAEALLYQVAYAYEQETAWHTMHPTRWSGI